MRRFYKQATLAGFWRPLWKEINGPNAESAKEERIAARTVTKINLKGRLPDRQHRGNVALDGFHRCLRAAQGFALIQWVA